MAATSFSFFSLLFSLDSPLYHHRPVMLFFVLFFFFFTLSLCSITLIFLLHNNGVRRTPKTQHIPQTLKQVDPSIDKIRQPCQCNPDVLTCSILLEIVPSSSSERETLCEDEVCGIDPIFKGSVTDLDKGEGDSSCTQKSLNKKKKKKKLKKKVPSSPNLKGEDDINEEKCVAKDELGLNEKHEFLCPSPFTSSSPTQRKIKQHFDQLVKSHESKKITHSQIVQFANCLIEVRHELQHKSEAIKRKFTITKALLHKADRSSFDRLCQQINKIEMEQKRLEEDAFVYNLLQEQLKLSPAYKKMLKISYCLKEMKEKSETDPEFSEISFEDFLAQEKKDSFWQNYGKSRSYSR